MCDCGLDRDWIVIAPGKLLTTRVFFARTLLDFKGSIAIHELTIEGQAFVFTNPGERQVNSISASVCFRYLLYDFSAHTRLMRIIRVMHAWKAHLSNLRILRLRAD